MFWKKILKIILNERSVRGNSKNTQFTYLRVIAKLTNRKQIAVSLLFYNSALFDSQRHKAIYFHVKLNV